MSNLPAPTNGGVPDFLQGKRDHRGIEVSKASDLVFPRLVVMQNNTQEVIDGKFKNGDIVRRDTNEVFIPYGSEGVLVPIKFQREFIHWASRSSKKGVLARSTDENSDIAKRAQAQLANSRKSGKPADTVNEETFNEAHSWLFAHKTDSGMKELLVLSFAKGSIREGRQLISTIHQMRVPAFALRFRFKAEVRKNPKGVYMVAEPRRLGFVDKEDFEEYEKIYESLSDASFQGNTDEDGGGGDSEPGSAAGAEV